MPTQLFLIAPPETAPETLAQLLRRAGISALLLQRGNHAENAYKTWVKSVLPIAQSAGCAALIEGQPGWVRALKADGLHLNGALEAVQEAVEALKPDLIVGTASGKSRHDAMSLGELGVDYLMFGPTSGALSQHEAETAAWWAETMEIPAVLSDPQVNAESFDTLGCEFLALSESLWNGPSRAEDMIAQFARQIEAAA